MAADEDLPSSWPVRLITIFLSLFQDGDTPPADDRRVLLSFKATLSPASVRDSGVLASWVDGKGPCLGKNVSVWQGVYCDDEGRVSTVQLENLGLSGALNIDVLSRLPGLRYLLFSHNSFEGAIPNISKLPDLKSLFLTGNRFSGKIPDGQFTNMRALKKLWLSQNNFSGEIPSSLTAPEKLIEVGLDDNKFEGTIPDMQQEDLKVVNVARNQLEGPIPEQLKDMNADYFEGRNKNLCGQPLDASCAPALMAEMKKKKKKEEDKISTGLVVVIALLSVIILLLIILLIFCICCRRKRKERSRVDQSPSGEAGDIEHLESGRNVEPAGVKVKAAKKDNSKLAFVLEERRTFDLQDLLKASAEVLGSGNFGSSYKAALTESSAVVVKRFKDMNAVGREDFQEHMRRIGRLSHPNLLPLVAYYYRKEEKLLITDYSPGGSLAHMLHGSQTPSEQVLDWPTRLNIIKGVGRGLAFLYEVLPMLAVPHGHLKSSNVLLNASLDPMLSDYALAPVMNKTIAAQLMVAYKSPECAESGKPSAKSDVWSFGILILEMLTGEFPADFLCAGSTNADLSRWVNSVVKEKHNGEVFDENMKVGKKSKREMSKLLQIGMDCCEPDVQKRLDIKAALEKIEELTGIEDDAEDSNEGDVFASRATSEENTFSR